MCLRTGACVMDSKKRRLPRTEEVHLFCFGIRFHHTKMKLPEELAEQNLLTLHDVADSVYRGDQQ